MQFSAWFVSFKQTVIFSRLGFKIQDIFHNISIDLSGFEPFFAQSLTLEIISSVKSESSRVKVGLSEKYFPFIRSTRWYRQLQNVTLCLGF